MSDPFFLRIFQHLLPRATAWRLGAQKKLQDFFEGLSGAPTDARQFIDDVHDDIYPKTTRELPTWEAQFGLQPGADTTDAERRAHLDAAWKSQGGQSPRYLQDVVQAAGFPLYIHEWWDPDFLPTIVARDPHVYTKQPLIGAYRCKPFLDGVPLPLQKQAICKAKTLTVGGVKVPQKQAICTRWLNNETSYIVNLNLTREAPPPIPYDTSLTPHEGATYPFFLTWCGETYGERVSVPAGRRNELERLLKKLCPSQQWLVVLVDYV